MAIRPLKNGRVAFFPTYRQFSIGGGTKWIFDRQVLSRGAKGKPSHFGKLLVNTFRWLAEPSLAKGELGGHQTVTERLLPENYASDRMVEHFPYKYENARLAEAQPRNGYTLYRGLIGARTAYSAGTGSVAEYAAAAKEAGLDFVVFLEEYASLTPENYKKLKEECKQLSNGDLTLIPGFSIESNIGNNMFFYGPKMPLPPDNCLTGKDRKQLYQQEENDKGGYTGRVTPLLGWILYHASNRAQQAGYYHFTEHPGAMQMHDCRAYAMAAVRYYRDGELVEDVTDEYLLTAQSTIPPSPISLNEVDSPDALKKEVERGNALTWALARSRPALMADALSYRHQYAFADIFPSDGPRILRWPDTHRSYTYGGEMFVRWASLFPSPLLVTSEKGLKEIRIYNGSALFRRFVLNGEKEFARTLLLDGTVHKNLVAVAEDVDGGKAVSFANRCWKAGSLSPVFCGDHVNDCKLHFMLAHGPYSLPFNHPPAVHLNISGYTWDGGPTGCLPLVPHQENTPRVVTENGEWNGDRFAQVPMLECADEGVCAVRSVRTRLYADSIERVRNPWNTYGPLGGEATLFTYVHRYRQWIRPTVDVPHTYWVGPGVFEGANASLFTSTITYKKDATVKEIYLGRMDRSAEGFLVYPEGDAHATFDMGAKGYPKFDLQPGQWFGIYGKGATNAHLFVNRGAPLSFRVAGMIQIYEAGKEHPVTAGETHRLELAAYGFPITVPIRGPGDFARRLDYVAAPEGMLIVRGARVESPGLVEFAPEAYAVEFYLPRPQTRTDLTLPVIVNGLNRRWSAGLYQKKGYTKGTYGHGDGRYRALGVDMEGNAYIPVFVDHAPATWMVAGHPVVAGPEGKDLFLQVTKVSDRSVIPGVRVNKRVTKEFDLRDPILPDLWYVAVNNPTDEAITTTIRPAMDLPGLRIEPAQITLQPGEFRVLQGGTE